MFDPYSALARSLEREAALLWNLKELLTALDESGIGPTSKLLPRWQLERIEVAIDSSEEEVAMLTEVLGYLDEEGEDRIE